MGVVTVTSSRSYDTLIYTLLLVMFLSPGNPIIIKQMHATEVATVNKHSGRIRDIFWYCMYSIVRILSEYFNFTRPICVFMPCRAISKHMAFAIVMWLSTSVGDYQQRGARDHGKVTSVIERICTFLKSGHARSAVMISNPPCYATFTGTVFLLQWIRTLSKEVHSCVCLLIRHRSLFLEWTLRCCWRTNIWHISRVSVAQYFHYSSMTFEYVSGGVSVRLKFSTMTASINVPWMSVEPSGWKVGSTWHFRTVSRTLTFSSNFLA